MRGSIEWGLKDGGRCSIEKEERYSNAFTMGSTAEGAVKTEEYSRGGSDS